MESKNISIWTLIFISIFTVITINNSFANNKSDKPNVLFIAIDDLKPMLGCYGNDYIHSPNLDKLAKSGFVFMNNHCQQAVCAPTRASLLSGRRPDYTRVWDLKTQIRDMNPDIVSLPQYFKMNGYETAAVGKVFDVRSVDEQHDSVSWTLPYQKIERADKVGGGWVFTKEKVTTEAPIVEDSKTMDGEVVTKGIKLLDQLSEGEKPFFLAVGFHKPHLPFVAPKKYWDLYQREDIAIHPYPDHAEGTPEWAYQPGWEIRSLYKDIPKEGRLSTEKQKELIHGYYACVSFIDQQVGNVLIHLKKKKLHKNTIVIVWGDHGWHLGDHSMWCKHTNFEQATRSPMIISYRKNFIGNTEAPTEFVDIYPTLCDIAGLPAKSNLDGKSLVPLMENKISESKLFAVSQFTRQGTYMGYAFRDKRYRYIVWLKNNFRTSMPYKKELIVARELYDYDTDPFETKNLVNEEKYNQTVKQFETWSTEFFANQYRKLN